MQDLYLQKCGLWAAVNPLSLLSFTTETALERFSEMKITSAEELQLGVTGCVQPDRKHYEIQQN